MLPMLLCNAYNIVIFNELIKYFKNFSALISNLIPIDTTNIKKKKKTTLWDSQLFLRV